MSNEFQKPFTAPPAIFAAAVLLGMGIEVIYPLPSMPLLLQLGLGVAVLTVGGLLIRKSMQSIDAAGTTYNPYAASTVLVTTGIYEHTRNPGYLGLAVIQLGLALIIDSLWIAATAVAAIMVTDHFVIRLEEKKLRRAFGQDYIDYLARVRRWI